MIFADKIIRLRKKNGWSQEELAEKMNVSRQAISKWESAQTVPEINKLLQLAELFSVTTDYLLKDDMEDEEFCESTGDTEEKHRVITLQEASDYLRIRKMASIKTAIATFLCILSPIPLVILGAASENGYPITENAAGVIGIILLLVAVAAAAPIFIFCYFESAPFEFITNGKFECAYGVKGMVREEKKKYQSTYNIFCVIGTVICILAPIALFCSAFSENEMIEVSMLSVMLFFIGIGVLFFVISGIRMSAMQRLLKEGEFKEKSKKDDIKGVISAVYWLVTTAAYLTVSFVFSRWEISWVIWPISAVLFAAVTRIYDAVIASKNDID